MHQMKVFVSIIGVVLIIAGLAQGLSLTGMLGQSMFENPPFLSGLIGGIIPCLCGGLGTYFITWAFVEPPLTEDKQ